MGRAYAGAAGTHMVLGFLCIAAGITWICLLNFYGPFFVVVNNESVSLLSIIPAWFSVILSAKIICGFWFFVTGAVGCCIQSRGCTEGVWVALNVLNVIIWAPALMATMAGVGAIIMLYGAAILQSFTGSADPDDIVKLFTAHLWLWAFPAIGVLIGFVEFILSIVSYSIVCCCRPSQLSEGYEYQYEMK